ncbi:MAG: 4Fe-4S dicluster domain-containing protein [Planctomycetota bacterium]
MADGRCNKNCGGAVRFGDSPGNWLRITTIRIIVQAILFAMFLSFVVLTTFVNLDRFPALRLWVSKVLEIDPLIALATAITTHTLYAGLRWSLVVLLPTLFLGRVFCNWVCPYGTLHQFVGWAFRRRRPEPRAVASDLRAGRMIEANRYHGSQRVKYLILTAMLFAAALGTLQIGLLDPICMVYRSFTGAVLPAAGMPLSGVLGDARLHQGGFLIGVLLFGLVAMNLIRPRFFCRVLCPLGAMLGILSRWSWWRIERDPEKCTDCDRCLVNCEAAADPHGSLRKSECFVCLNCIEDCPEGALRFAFMPGRARELKGTDVPRRKLVFAAIAGVLFYPFARSSGRTTRDFSSKAIRPPGSVEESAFLERCIKCDQCARVCPTNVVQPAWFEAGVEGLWTPVMNFRMGHCQLNCTACGEVCPTGAIRRVSVEEKLGLGAFTAAGPIKLGTAHFDFGRCLPYSQDLPCVVCEEVCPTSPKAIYTERQVRTLRAGRKMATGSTPTTVTVCEWPEGGQATGKPTVLTRDQFKGDETTTYHVFVRHPDGMTETQLIVGNDADTLTVSGVFVRPPERGAAVTLKSEYAVPKIDAALCIGCGLCERECPVVGDRRAVYVTCEGETRSRGCGERDRNRSLLLMGRGS